MDDLQQPRAAQRDVGRDDARRPADPRRVPRRSRRPRRRGHAVRAPRAFVSGADISEFGERRTSVDARADYDTAIADAWRMWRELDKPILAMIRGYCIGGGLLVAMRADIRIAAEDSQFARAGGAPRPRLRVRRRRGARGARRSVVGGGDPVLRPAAVGRRGVADRAGEPRRARRRARRPGAGARACDRRQRAAHGAGVQGRDPRGVARAGGSRPGAVDELVEACFRSEDYLEGQAAFAEKRPPRFRGI